MNRRNFLGMAMAAPLVPVVAEAVKAKPRAEHWTGVLDRPRMRAPDCMTCVLKGVSAPAEVGRMFEFEGRLWRVVEIRRELAGNPLMNGWVEATCVVEDPEVWG